MSGREQPCPYRIIDDFGGGFGMGCIAGCIWYFMRGMWFSPKNERFYGGISLLKKRAPVLGGSFGMWAGLFGMTECFLVHIRQKEDFLNPIAGGFVTGGLLAFRAGYKIAFRNAMFGGIILCCIQAVEQGMIKYNMKKEMEFMQKMQQEEAEKQLQMLKDYRPDIYEQIMTAKKNDELKKKQKKDNAMSYDDTSFKLDKKGQSDQPAIKTY